MFLYITSYIKSALAHLASAFVLSVSDLILQLVREDISDSQLLIVFEYSSEWVRHIKCGRLFILTHFQLEIWSAYLR